MDSNIQTLVFKAKQGDNSAFSTLYQIYYPKMKGICINILKEDKDVIDDLVQDAFILALVSLKDLKNPNRFGQWLTSITSNLALKYKEKGNTFRYEPTLKSKVCLKCLYFTKIISALCCYLEYFSYLYTIN